ncbi:hypothetical protein ACFQ0B_18335 [Nonomuraea thailandensis]
MSGSSTTFCGGCQSLSISLATSVGGSAAAGIGALPPTSAISRSCAVGRSAGSMEVARRTSSFSGAGSAPRSGGVLSTREAMVMGSPRPNGCRPLPA